MRRLLGIALWSALIMLLLAAAAALVLYRGTRYVPEFYQQALAPEPSPQQQVEVADDFERDVLALHNAAGKPGRWEARFTDEQANAWLTAVLPENYPQALPAEVEQPRVKLTARSAHVAWRYPMGGIKTVVSLKADVYLTDQPNQVAIRLRAIRAGRVPIPPTQILAGVSEAAREAGVDLTWSQQNGDPVALLRIPIRHPQFTDRQLLLETLELEDGKVRLAGSTKRDR